MLARKMVVDIVSLLYYHKTKVLAAFLGCNDTRYVTRMSHKATASSLPSSGPACLFGLIRSITISTLTPPLVC